jgi:hypothetical protein
MSTLECTSFSSVLIRSVWHDNPNYSCIFCINSHFQNDERGIERGRFCFQSLLTQDHCFSRWRQTVFGKGCLNEHVVSSIEANGSQVSSDTFVWVESEISFFLMLFSCSHDMLTWDFMSIWGTHNFCLQQKRRMFANQTWKWCLTDLVFRTAFYSISRILTWSFASLSVFAVIAEMYFSSSLVCK